MKFPPFGIHLMVTQHSRPLTQQWSSAQVGGLPSDPGHAYSFFNYLNDTVKIDTEITPDSLLMDLSLKHMASSWSWQHTPKWGLQTPCYMFVTLDVQSTGVITGTFLQ